MGFNTKVMGQTVTDKTTLQYEYVAENNVASKVLAIMTFDYVQCNGKGPPVFTDV